MDLPGITSCLGRITGHLFQPSVDALCLWAEDHAAEQEMCQVFVRPPAELEQTSKQTWMAVGLNFTFSVTGPCKGAKDFLKDGKLY